MFLPGSLALSRLPVFAVIGVLSRGAARHDTAPTEIGALEVYPPPSPATDAVHMVQLGCLLQTIQTYDRRSGGTGRGRPNHAGLADEYRLIVRETTPERILRAGLPLDLR